MGDIPPSLQNGCRSSGSNPQAGLFVSGNGSYLAPIRPPSAQPVGGLQGGLLVPGAGFAARPAGRQIWPFWGPKWTPPRLARARVGCPKSWAVSWAASRACRIDGPEIGRPETPQNHRPPGRSSACVPGSSRPFLGPSMSPVRRAQIWPKIGPTSASNTYVWG